MQQHTVPQSQLHMKNSWCSSGSSAWLQLKGWAQFGFGLYAFTMWLSVCNLQGENKIFVCLIMDIGPCAKEMGKMKSVLGRIHHKMSHVSLCIIHKGTQLSRADWWMQLLFWGICEEDMKIDWLWHPDLKSAFFKGQLKINAWKLTAKKMNKSLQQGEESKQLNPKCNARRMIAHYKSEVIQMQFVISNSCDSVGQVQSLMLRSLLQAAASGRHGVAQGWRCLEITSWLLVFSRWTRACTWVIPCKHRA